MICAYSTLVESTSINNNFIYTDVNVGTGSQPVLLVLTLVLLWS